MVNRPLFVGAIGAVIVGAAIALTTYFEFNPEARPMFGLIAELAGAQGPGPDVLGPEELFLSEQHWRTYRKDGFKLHVDRRSGETRLSDLSSPDAERAVDPTDHPELVRDYLARTRELAKALAPRHAPETRLTDEDRARLRALGYVGGDAGPVTPKRNDSR